MAPEPHDGADRRPGVEPRRLRRCAPRGARARTCAFVHPASSRRSASATSRTASCGRDAPARRLAPRGAARRVSRSTRRWRTRARARASGCCILAAHGDRIVPAEHPRWLARRTGTGRERSGSAAATSRRSVRPDASARRRLDASSAELGRAAAAVTRGDPQSPQALRSATTRTHEHRDRACTWPSGTPSRAISAPRR